MYYNFKKKQRGQKRKLRAMFRAIDTFMPFKRQARQSEFEHFHVPYDWFIQHNKTYGHIKTEFCKKWLDTTEKFIREKPSDFSFCKVVALISVSSFWNSQIIIFYDKFYYETFWDRNNEYQKWVKLDSQNSFVKERNIETTLLEQGYHETINDEEFIFNSSLWYYGELDVITPEKNKQRISSSTFSWVIL